MRLRRALLTFLLLGLLCGQARAQDWEPKRTYALVVGILEWQDKASYVSFPKTERRDARLVATLRQRGVPREQVVYLQDKAATLPAIQTALANLLKRTHSGDTLLVYYCGHGYRSENGSLYYVSYDANEKTLGWSAASLVERIEKGFPGTRALLTADCCYSGTMADIVRKRKRRVSYACLASSLSSESSTGAWTFTEALLDGLTGKPYVDSNTDGRITLGEMGTYIRDEMRFGDEQRATFSATPGFGAQTIFALASSVKSPRLGERVMATSGGTAYKGKIVARREGAFRIHYYGYDDADDEWLPASALAAPKQLPRYAVGQKVEVEWKGRWYRAHVLKAENGSHFITYDGYTSVWDEWVSSKRIRPPLRRHSFWK